MIIGLDYRPALLSRTGIARVTRELARHLAQLDEVKEVRLFGSSLAPAAIPLEPLPHACRLHRLPIPGRTLPLLHRLGIGADTLCGGCDLFLWTDFVFPPLQGKSAMILHDLAFMANRKWHGPESDMLAARTRTAASQAKIIFVPSPQILGDVYKHLPEIKDRTHVIPWGADHTPTPGAETRTDPNLLVAVGTVEPRKDHLTLLAAFDLLKRKQPQAKLIVAGRQGWQATEVAAELTRRTANPKSGLRWEKDLDDEQLFALLARANALVYPSGYEGFGLPVVEALALGVPPIVAKDTACAWVAGGTGTTFPPGDAQALSHAMAAKPDREKCRKRAREFTWTESAKKLVNLVGKELSWSP